jgi:DNA invertase Pin-like site-specific DNA recombinase
MVTVMPVERSLTLSETLHVYTRVSTVAQADEGMSLEVQRDIGIARAQSLGFEHKIWNEGGRSSNHEEIDKRPVLSQVYDGIRKGVIKHLFVYDQSRLSRNDNVSSIFRYECNKQGVTLYNKEGKYDLGNHQDQFLKQILDAVGQFDNAQRAERTRLGKLSRVRQGNWMGGPPPFGYEIKDKKLVIDPEESVWVQKIFEMYADRVPTMDIKIELDANGVSPRRKLGTWSIGSLQALMTNTHYLGYWDFHDKKTGEEVRVECPRILSSDLWSKVQKTKEVNTERSRNLNPVKHFYMLKNIRKCGHCGTWMSGLVSKTQSKHHYYCPKKERVWSKRPIALEDKWKRGRVCDMTRSLNIDDADELVWNAVVEVLSNSKIIREGIKADVMGEGVGGKQQTAADTKAANLKVRQLKKNLAKVVDALNRVETDRLMERLSPDQYPVVRANITSEKVSIEAEIEQVEAALSSVNQQKKWIDWVAKFQRKIATYKDFSPVQRKEFLMGLVTEIQVHLVDPTTHWLEIEFQLPLIEDELVYVGSSKKALGYALKDGSKTLMIESPARPYSKKKTMRANGLGNGKSENSPPRWSSSVRGCF